MINVPLLSIEVVNGCNLSCNGCSHGSPSEKIQFYDPDLLRKHLDFIVLRPKLIEISGGEPTLHPKLDSVVDVINTFANRVGAIVRLITNGTKLSKWESLPIEQVSWSKYPGQPDPNYSGSARRYKVLDRSNFRVQYGTPDNVEQTYRNCALAHRWKCLVLKSGQLYRCGPSITLGALGVDPTNASEITNLIALRPSQCSGCFGTSGPLQPWLQQTEWR
jgi:hypothetical protein